MKHITMVLFTVALVSLLSGAVSAAELHVLVIGRGFVEGEGFGCKNSCKKTYEEGTVVQLKAIPIPGSDACESASPISERFRSRRKSPTMAPPP